MNGLPGPKGELGEKVRASLKVEAMNISCPRHLQGIPGIEGIPGLDGEPGHSVSHTCTCTSAAVNAADMPACSTCACITDFPTCALTAVCNCFLLQGFPGDDGPQGPVGPTGLPVSQTETRSV